MQASFSRQEVNGMKKKKLNGRALEKEAAFWSGLKKILAKNPARICRK